MKIDIAVCGPEGAGKSTVVRLLEKIAVEAGHSTRRVSFMLLPFNFLTSPHLWFARSAKKRAGFKEGVPMDPYDPKLRALLDVKPSELSAAFVAVYMLRVLAFRAMFAVTRRKDVMVYERYFYDNIARKLMRSRVHRWMEWSMLAVTPTPTVVFLLDPGLEEVSRRRPRISRATVETMLDRYRAVTGRVATTIAVDTSGPDLAVLETRLRQHLERHLQFRKSPTNERVPVPEGADRRDVEGPR